MRSTCPTFCFRPLSARSAGSSCWTPRLTRVTPASRIALELRRGEELRDPLDGDLGGRGQGAHGADDVQELPVLLGREEVRRPAAEVDRPDLVVVEPAAVELALRPEVAEVRHQLLRALVDLAGEEAEAAPVRGGREAERDADVDQQVLAGAGARVAPPLQDLVHGDVRLVPERRGGVAVEHAVAVTTEPIPVDLLVHTLDAIVHLPTSILSARVRCSPRSTPRAVAPRLTGRCGERGGDRPVGSAG